MTPQAYELHALTTAATAAQVGWESALARESGGELWREAGVLCVRKLAPRDEVIVLFPPRPDGSAIDRILGRAGERGVPHVGVWSSGLGDDDKLRDVLERRRFEEAWRHHWMCRDLGAAPPPDPRIEATEVRARGSWRFELREDGDALGSAWLHVPETAPHVGGVFDVFVAEHARRRGLGSALTNAVCDKALELGCRHAVLNALGDGEPLFEALGFRSLGYGRTWWFTIARFEG